MAKTNGHENLIPIKTSERAKELRARVDDKKKGENLRKKNLFKKEILKQLNAVTGENATNLEKGIEAMINQMQDGNVRAFEALRDTIGEKPKETIEHEGDIPVVIHDDIKE